MSWVQPKGGREGRKRRGGGGGGGGGGEEEEEEDGLDSYCDRAMNQMTYQPSGKPSDRRLDVPHRPEMPLGTRPSNSVTGQQMLPHPPPRNSSVGWQEERPLPPLRNSLPVWHEERRLADSDTLHARRRTAQPAKKETRDTYQRQPTSKGAKVHFQRPVERRQRSPEYEEEEEKSGSSPGDSFGGFTVNVEKGESKPDDQDLSLSYYFHVIEHEGAGSGDEDGFVHVPRGSPHGSPRGSPSR